MTEILKALDAITSRVLAYRPKEKGVAATKMRKQIEKADVRAAKAAAGKFGRPKRFERDGPEIAGMRFMLCEGMSVARVAKAFSVAPATIRNYIPTSEIQKLRPKS